MLMHLIIFDLFSDGGIVTFMLLNFASGEVGLCNVAFTVSRTVFCNDSGCVQWYRPCCKAKNAYMQYFIMIAMLACHIM